MSDVSKRLHRSCVLPPIQEQKSPRKSNPTKSKPKKSKAKAPVKRSNLTTAKDKKKAAASAPKPKKKKLTAEEKAKEKYPDEEFDPVNEPEQIFGPEEEEFSEEQIDEEKARLEIGIVKILANSKIPLSNEYGKVISEVKAVGIGDEDADNEEVEDNTVAVASTAANDDHNSSDEEDNALLDEKEEDIEVPEMEDDNEESKSEEIKMKFFMPIPRNVIGVDRLMLTNTPLIHDDTDDYRVCRSMYENFDGVHGYLEDKYVLGLEQICEAMADLLPGTQNPDLFYHTLYLLFPNHGSQKTFSIIFSDLVKRFVHDENERERLLKLEPWKTAEMMKKEKRAFQEPADFKNRFSHANYLTKSIKLPSGDSNSVCSENCYNAITEELVQLVGRHSSSTHQMKIFIPKTTKKDCDFLNTLILEDSENDLVENFCQIAGRFESNTCIGWFRAVMAVNKEPSGEQLGKVPPKKLHQNQYKAFRNMMAKVSSRLQKERERALNEQADDDEDDDPKQFQRSAASGNELRTKSIMTPCCHLGPCGHDAPFCSCDTICSVYCQCDADCGRRFPGCRCKPDQCRTNSCPCYRLNWECMPSTCKNCPDVDHPEDPDFVGCRNKYLTYGVQKKVSIGKSGIAGNGAFIGEDVKKDEFIGEYTGEYISEEETDRRGCFYNLKISYVFSLGGSCGSIDSDRCGSLMRFLNHSKTPNCYIKVRYVHGKLRIGFFAGMDIKSGTELTINYAYDADHADMHFNVAPEDRIPKYVDDEPSTSEKKKKPRTRRSIIKKDDDTDIETRRSVVTITRSGRRSVRFSDPNEPSTSQQSGSSSR